MATKFVVGDRVKFQLGTGQATGKVAEPWPEERLNGAEQHYFVEADNGGTYDVDESKMELAPAPIAEQAPAEFPPPEPEGAHLEGERLTNPETLGLMREEEAGAVG